MVEVAKPFLKPLVKLKALLVFCGLMLFACAPVATEPIEVRLFFSTEIWGQLPFTTLEQRLTLKRAIDHDSVEILSQDIPFLLVQGNVELIRSRSVFQVDGQTAPPQMQAGYELVFLLPYPKNHTVTLTNRLNGISRSITIKPTF